MHHMTWQALFAAPCQKAAGGVFVTEVVEQEVEMERLPRQGGH
jgi:hypothetical protein